MYTVFFPSRSCLEKCYTCAHRSTYRCMPTPLFCLAGTSTVSWCLCLYVQFGTTQFYAGLYEQRHCWLAGSLFGCGRACDTIHRQASTDLRLIRPLLSPFLILCQKSLVQGVPYRHLPFFFALVLVGLRHLILPFLPARAVRAQRVEEE